MGQTEVSCDIREYRDAEARGARLVENLQGADLTPLEEAESYQRRLAAAIEEGKLLTAAELDHEIGKNEKFVRFRLRLLDAMPPLQEPFARRTSRSLNSRENQLRLMTLRSIAHLRSSARGVENDWGITTLWATALAQSNSELGH